MATLSTPQPARHPDPTVKAQRLAYLVLERPDLEKTEVFLNAFGLETADRTPDALYMRGAAAAPFCYVVRRAATPRFGGVALEVADRAALQRLEKVPGASSIAPLDTPGGGEAVRLRDPSGIPVEAVCGQKPYAASAVRAPLTINTGDSHPRVNDTQRPPLEPPAILKLGHAVLELADYQATAGWYTKHFGLIPSDVQVLPDGAPVIAFFRLDLGDTPADHHTIAMGQGFAPRFNHAAFEVTDLDAVGVGQRILREKGYDHAWGIGRHILGSQVFDYWYDPWGDKHEHYCDGDLFTADAPMGVSLASPTSLAQWGPPLPARFVKPKLNFETVGAVVRGVRTSPDLSVRKLIKMARIFA